MECIWFMKQWFGSRGVQGWFLGEDTRSCPMSDTASVIWQCQCHRQRRHPTCGPWRDQCPSRQMCPEGSYRPWRAHAGVGSQQKLRSVVDTCWSSPHLKDCTPWKRPMLEQLMKDCIPWEGCHAGAEEKHEEKGTAKCYEPIAFPMPLRCSVGRR